MTLRPPPNFYMTTKILLEEFQPFFINPLVQKVVQQLHRYLLKLSKTLVPIRRVPFACEKCGCYFNKEFFYRGYILECGR